MVFEPYKIMELSYVEGNGCEDKTNCIIILKLKPLSNGKIFAHKPGQFAMFEIDGIRRAYSIASEPDSDYLEFAIHLIGGKITSKLAEKTVGDTINISGPYGNHFVYTGQTNVGLLGAGAGITSLMSIIRHIHKNKIRGNFTLFYTARNMRYMPYLNELNEISKSRQIQFVPTLTRVEKGALPNWAGEFGRINKKMISKYVKDVRDKMWFMCGSMKFIDAMKTDLLELGAYEKMVISEGWG